jgi:hypothetical protein
MIGWFLLIKAFLLGSRTKGYPSPFRGRGLGDGGEVASAARRSLG